MAYSRRIAATILVAVLGPMTRARLKNLIGISFATLRISTVLAMLWTLPVSPVTAIPIHLTGGGIEVDLNTRTQDFFHTFVGLRAPGFELTTDPRYDLFSAFEPVAPLGSTVNFSGGLNILSAANPGEKLNLFYGGRSYWARGFIGINTPSTTVGPLVTLPFSLFGEIHATDFMGTDFDFQLVGAGTATAGYFLEERAPDALQWRTLGVRYDVEAPPIPEPTSWTLFGSGLLGYAARRRSARRKV